MSAVALGQLRILLSMSKKRDHCWLHSHASLRTYSFTRRSCLNDRVPGLITVKREPRYIVKAGMKFGLNKITLPQMNARTFSAESRIVGFWGSAILKPRLSFMWKHFGEEEMLRLQNPHPCPKQERPRQTYDEPIRCRLSALAGCLPFSWQLSPYYPTNILLTLYNLNLSISDFWLTELSQAVAKDTKMLQLVPAWGGANTFLFLVASDQTLLRMDSRWTVHRLSTLCGEQLGTELRSHRSRLRWEDLALQ